MTAGAHDDPVALTEGIDGWLPEFEGRHLLALARRCTGRGVIVEIGSWKGRSTIWLALGSRAGAGGRVYAIDPHTGSWEHQAPGTVVATFEDFRRNIARAGVGDLVVPLVMPSVEAAGGFAEPVELIFIDGAHGYEDVKQDFLAWFPKVVEGGIMAFHDTTVGWEGPRRVVEEMLFRSPRFRRVGLVGSITYAEKVAQATAAERLRNRYALAVKQAGDAARGLRLPAGVRRVARRLAEALLDGPRVRG
ncbi:MAG: class I SAM-dependent methyltransferase [Candidatus Rokubacteria bacterium]|nr:class I SAM-dependent methyltransferase [Candidatus Rokubacteria bacterium]